MHCLTQPNAVTSGNTIGQGAKEQRHIQELIENIEADVSTNNVKNPQVNLFSRYKETGDIYRSKTYMNLTGSSGTWVMH